MQHAWSLSLRLKHRDKETGLSHGQTGVVCFSLLFCRALGLRACPELAFWLSQSHEAQESKLLWPPGPGGPESRKLLYIPAVGCADLLALARMKECWGQDTRDVHWRQGKPGAWARLGDRAGVGVPPHCGSHDSAARLGWWQVLGAERACSFTEAVSPSSPAQVRYRKNARMALGCASVPRKLLTCPCPPGML